jgi:hypothetical protein
MKTREKFMKGFKFSVWKIYFSFIFFHLQDKYSRTVVFNWGYVDYTICITCIMYQQLWGYKVEEKLYLGVCEQKRLNTTALGNESELLPWYVFIINQEWLCMFVYLASTPWKQHNYFHFVAHIHLQTYMYSTYFHCNPLCAEYVSIYSLKSICE